MNINGKEVKLSEFAAKITASVNKAIRQMAEKAAANDESLVIGNLDGTAKLVPAKEVLKNMSK